MLLTILILTFMNVPVVYQISKEDHFKIFEDKGAFLSGTVVYNSAMFMRQITNFSHVKNNLVEF